VFPPRSGDEEKERSPKQNYKSKPLDGSDTADRTLQSVSTTEPLSNKKIKIEIERKN
jgi:hypothetical protein